LDRVPPAPEEASAARRSSGLRCPHERPTVATPGNPGRRGVRRAGALLKGIGVGGAVNRIAVLVAGGSLGERVPGPLGVRTGPRVGRG
jgi:hypothetical protein